MKQTNLLKTFLLLCALVVGSTCAWAEDKTDVLTASLFNATSTTYTDFSGVSVSGGSDAVYAGNNGKTSSGGIQLRSKNSNSGIVSTVSGGDRVKSVSITVESGSNTLDIYGSNTAYSDAKDLYNTSTQGTKLGSLNSDGTVTITGDYKYIGLRSNNGALYLTDITIVWENSGGAATPSISADNVNIEYDATGGSIAYTVNNAVDGGSVSAAIKTGDWLTLGAAATSPVSFTCAANTAATARTATVTLTYTYNTTETVTKDVTITQAGDPDAVMTIAEVRAQGTGSVHTKGVVTSINGKTAYIQDAGAAIAVYNSAANLAVTVGDNIDVSGTLGSYGGLLQIQSPTISVLSQGNTVTPEVMTIAQINESTKQGWLVKIEEATVSSISSQNVTIKQSDNTIVVRFNSASDITFDEDDVITLTGNIGSYSNNPQIANPTDVSVKVITTPSITITADDPVNVDATSDSGEFPLTYANLTISAADDFAVQYYNSNDEEISEPAWITVAVEAATPSGYKVSYAVDDNDGEARSAYFKVWALDGSTPVYSNKVTITQAAYVAPAAPGNWALATAGLTDINSNDVFVIVGNDGDTYAMTNNKGTSAPEAAEVTVVNNTLSGTIAANLQWNLGSDKDGYIFYPNGSTTTWLYCTNSNNGVKVGTGAAKHFTLSGGYLTTTETSEQRYIGIYNSQDWRCYTGTTGNIAGQTFAFYKKLAAKLNAYGYATFSSTVPVDFSQASDFTAWIITKIEGGTITFSQVTGSVPAGTGVLLKGTADQTVEFVATASGTALADNKFVGITTATAVTADTYFGLSGNKFVKVGAGTIKAGKALLPATEVSGARELTFVFDDATGIKQVESSKMNVEDIYNLNGQKVQNPTKGLYIMNGKKVIIK